jgi:Pyruvate/2-oxoacid:ferredoxin oxidoreductase delta subunit
MTTGADLLPRESADSGTAGLQAGDDPDRCGPEPGAWSREPEIAAEAKRCLSCGLCMDCERCWMYCTNNCFEKLPKRAGAEQHAGPERKLASYSVKLELCNGCRKCADECPCGYIEMV